MYRRLALSLMPKDVKKPLRPVRTLSKVADALANLDVAKSTSPVDADAPSEDKLESSSKYFKQAASSSPTRVESEPDALKPHAITLELLERDTMGASWYDALHPEFEKPYFAKVLIFLLVCFACHQHEIRTAKKVYCGGAPGTHRLSFTLRPLLCVTRDPSN